MSVLTPAEIHERAGQLQQDLDVHSRAREIVARHRSVEAPERPLFPIFAGAVLSLASFGAAIYVAYQAWYTERLSGDVAGLWLGGIFVAYAGGVLLFSYAYESYDIGKALKLAIILLLIAVAVVAIIGVVLAILAAMRDSDADLGDILGPAAKVVGELVDLADVGKAQHRSESLR